MSIDKMEGVQQNSSDSATPTNQDQPPSAVSSSSNAVYPQDPEKRKLIQQQLVLLIHAHKCQQREQREKEQQNRDGGAMNGPCTLPHCDTMKEVLNHMTSCNNGRNCQYTHCASSRQIIAHWKNCTRGDCPVCKPLRTVNNSNSFIADDKNTNWNQAGVHSSGVHSDHLGLTSSMEERVEKFLISNPPNTEDHITNKEWQLSMTKDLRNHLVGKLVKALIPSPDPKPHLDTRIRDSITYARKVEKEMFEMANDREEYFHLLAEKIFNIQKELEEENDRLRPEQLWIADLDELNAYTPQNNPLLPAATLSDENKEEQKKKDQQPLKQSNQSTRNVQNTVHHGSPTLPNQPNALRFGIPPGFSYRHQYPIMTPMMTPTIYGPHGISHMNPVTHVHSSTVPGVPGGPMYPGIPTVNVTVQYHPQDYPGMPSGMKENHFPHHFQPGTQGQPKTVNHGAASASTTTFTGMNNTMMQNRTSGMGHPSNRTTIAKANDPQPQPDESKEVSLLSKMSLKDRAKIFNEVMEAPISEYLKMEKMIHKDDEDETDEDDEDDDDEASEKENNNAASSVPHESLKYQPKQNQMTPGIHLVNGIYGPSFIPASQQPPRYPYPGAHHWNQMNTAYPGDPRRNPVNPHVPRNGMQGGFHGMHPHPHLPLANPYGISYQTRANPAMPTASTGHPQRPLAYPPLNSGQYPNAMTMPHVNPGPGVHPAYNGIRNGFAQPNQAPSVYDNTAEFMAQMSAVQHHMQLMQLQQNGQQINSGGSHQAMQQGPMHAGGISANQSSVNGRTLQNGNPQPGSQ